MWARFPRLRRVRLALWQSTHTPSGTSLGCGSCFLLGFPTQTRDLIIIQPSSKLDVHAPAMTTLLTAAVMLIPNSLQGCLAICPLVRHLRVSRSSLKTQGGLTARRAHKASPTYVRNRLPRVCSTQYAVPQQQPFRQLMQGGPFLRDGAGEEQEETEIAEEEGEDEYEEGDDGVDELDEEQELLLTKLQTVQDDLERVRDASLRAQCAPKKRALPQTAALSPLPSPWPSC